MKIYIEREITTKLYYTEYLFMENISLCFNEIDQEPIYIEKIILKINERTATDVVKNSVIVSSLFITFISLIVIR